MGVYAVYVCESSFFIGTHGTVGPIQPTDTLPHSHPQPTAARVPNRDRKRRVAIVGSGVTGLGAAYHLVTSCAEGQWARLGF